MSEDPQTQTDQIRVTCCGAKSVVADLCEQIQQRSATMSVTTASDRSSVPADTDCLVATEPKSVFRCSVPTILYTRVDPMDLHSDTLTAVDSLVQRDRPDALDRLIEKLQMVVDNQSNQMAPHRVVHDVTARNQRRQELCRYERLIQAVGAPICTLDEDGQIQYVNGQFEDRTGYTAADSVGNNLDLILDSDSTAQVQEALRQLGADENAAATLELQIEPRSGEAFPTECRLAGLPRSDDGHDSVAVAVFHDVTRLKQREQRLSKFASVVSHDLRNPMDVALGRAEMLPEIADVDDQTEQHLDDIYESIKRMERLIQDVLTLTRQHEESVDLEPLSLADVATAAWQNVATEQSNLHVDTDQRIEADQSRLVRVFENLFRNAVQHGGDGVTVRIEAISDSGQPIGFRIADDGPGIPDHRRGEIFEDGFSTAKDGTGLGLPIVRDIAHAHGWEVSVCASPTAGAQFEFRNIERADD